MKLKIGGKMNKYKNDYVWNQKMCHHLDKEYELECISLYRNCYDYSPIEHFMMNYGFCNKRLLLIETDN